ncbi:esterase-like activity of phytase family protein [Constantimarinum furrinae]|uniref:Uncharacterized protein n=1 Tax=Constantimarinum furrinae TaxID=2562285 RepID=A0A7G8PX97_9FLAO|nr:hypothetical protein [Constantimarinum furrinae]QNJ98963.1 hypothetical protein ALE3EI_2426 [Constantimarinum furrinae]
MKQLVGVFILAILNLGCQDLGKLQILASLPGELKEISGIEKIKGSELLWAITDSKNAADIFGYNTKTNSIDRVISLENGTNVDWEDIAGDGNGNLYVGDFGNNRNKRKDLTIYGIENVSNFTAARSSTIATVTTFNFEDQKEFPPKKKDRNFDVEAFIVKDGFFYLFTRNRSSHFDGTTKLYRVPTKQGSFEAELIGSYKTCEDDDDCQITAASIDRDAGKIALLSYNKVWIISEYKGDQFFKGKIEKINLDHRSQKESVTFKNSETLYIADELTGIEGGNLYELPI